MRTWLILSTLQFVGFWVYLLFLVHKHQGRGRGYWYLRAKWKMARQIPGLEEQLDAERVRTHEQEQAIVRLRRALKEQRDGA